jgi:hypothetical protein
MMDFDAKTGLWLPPKPAIIRKWKDEDAKLAMLPGMVPIIAGGIPLELTYVLTKGTTGNVTTVNFGDYTMPREGLLIAVFMSRGDSNRTVSSCTIGGSAGTIATQAGGTNNTKVAVGYRRVGAGVQAVSFTMSGSSGSNNNHVCSVWCLSGNLSDTPTSAAANTAGGTVKTITLDILGGGISVYGTVPQSSGSPSITWSTATQVNLTTLNSRRHSSAEKYAATTLTAHAETVTWGSSQSTGQCGASWR